MRLKRIMKRVIASALVSVMAVTAAGEYTPVEKVSASSVEIRENVNTPLKSGHVLVGVKGVDYTSNVAEVLKIINDERYRACQEGVINPATQQPLKPSDYYPLKIGSLCTKSAKIRAAEASLYLGHDRPNGEECHTVIRALHGSDYGLGWTGENLAWYPNKTTTISGWINEKSDYVNKVAGAVVGHYESLISTNFNYIGISSFNPDSDTQAWDWTCTEATFAGNDTEISPESEKNGAPVFAKVEVPLSNTFNQHISGVDTVEIGDVNSYEVLLSYDNKQSGNRASKVNDCTVLDKVTWASSDTSILKLNGAAFEALKTGNVTITAIVGEGNAALKLSKNIYVKPPHIVSQKLQFTEKTIKYKGTYVLPKMKVVWSNGDETLEDVTWNLSEEKIKKIKQIINNKNGGSFKVTGKFNGKSVVVKYTVNKKSSKTSSSNSSKVSSKTTTKKKTTSKVKVYKKGKILKDKYFVYKVIKSASRNGKKAGKLKIIRLRKKKLKKVTIKSKKKFGGLKYKITVISKKAFRGCKRLKRIVFKSKKLKKKYKKRYRKFLK